MDKSPVLLKAEERTRLTDKFNELTVHLIAIKQVKAIKWLELRATTKTNSEADRLWDASPEGLKEMEIELTLKAMSKSITSVKLETDVMRDEAKNQY